MIIHCENHAKQNKIEGQILTMNNSCPENRVHLTPGAIAPKAVKQLREAGVGGVCEDYLKCGKYGHRNKGYIGN